MLQPKTRKPPRKTRIVSYRLTEQEFLRLTHAAATAGLRVNDLARTLTLSRLERLIVKARERHDPALIKQLYHIGHNLNQLVKNAHIFHRVSPQVEELCLRIEAAMDEAIEEDLIR